MIAVAVNDGHLPTLDSASFGSVSAAHRAPQLEKINPIAYYHEFRDRFPEEVWYFKVVGIDPTKPEAILNPYTLRISEDRFTNIGEHCIAVAVCASRITAALVEKGVIDAETADRIVARALIHDLNKPFEIMRREAKKACLAADVYSVAAYEKVLDLLARTGYAAKHVDYIRRSGSETGHNSLAQFLRVGSRGEVQLVSDNLADKIVHIADDMTFTSRPDAHGEWVTHFLTCGERMTASQFKEHYPFLWSEGLMINKSGLIVPYQVESEITPPAQRIGNYAALQLGVASAICAEIKEYVAPDDSRDADQFIRDLVNTTRPLQ